MDFEEITPQQARRALLDQGAPEEIPDRLLGYLADRVRDPGPTTDTVRNILGRPALTFSDWARQNAAAFRADPSQDSPVTDGRTTRSRG